MLVKIPKVIKIGGLDYDVMMNDETTRELDAAQMYGQCSSFLKRLRVSNRLDKQQAEQTLLHEWVHAINDVFLNDTLNERDIGCLSQGLYQVLKQLGIEFDFSEVGEKPTA